MKNRSIFRSITDSIIELGEALVGVVALILIFAFSIIAFMLVSVFHMIGILYQNLTNR